MNIELDKIIVGKRRTPNPEKIKEIAASIEEVGLINPIVVYAEGNKTCKSAKIHLVAGMHRLEALKLLGHQIVNAEVVLEDRAELVEIDENMMREDLTEIDRARLSKRRVEILKQRLKELSPNSGPNSRGRPVTDGTEEAVRETAEISGRSRSGVYQDIGRANKIKVDDPIIEQASGVELDALASMEPDEQRQAVERVKTGASESFRDARDFIRGTTAEEDKTTKDLARLRSAWGQATEAARAQFWSEISGWRKSA